LGLIEKFKNKIFIIDETYLMFSQKYDKDTLSSYVQKFENLFVIISLSKFFSIGGIRVGLCFSSRKNIDFINNHKNYYSINILAERVIPLILKDKKYIKKTKDFVFKEMIRMYNFINKINGLKPFKPSANFILVKIENKKISLKKLIKYLSKKNVHIREGYIFKGLSGKYFRISIRKKEENEFLIKLLGDFINKYY